MLFYYKREVSREVLIGEGDNKQKEVVTETYWDCFNTEKIVRGIWTKPEEFTILLDDGHEQADDVQKPKFNAKGVVTGMEVKRERAWYVTQIVLDKEDAGRLKELTENMWKFYQS